MFGLIKLVIFLILITGVSLYGGDIWNLIKDKTAELADPEFQKANILDSLKNSFSQIEENIKRASENIDNPDFNEESVLTESLNLIQESKTNLQNLEGIEKPKQTITEKVFENLEDLKDGVKAIIFPGTEQNGSTEECECSLEN